MIFAYFKYRRDEYARAKKFISNIHPFNNLNTFELDDLVEDLDIVYFKANSIVQAQDSNPEFLYFVLKV